MAYSMQKLSGELAVLLANMPGAIDHAKVADWAYAAYSQNDDLEPDAGKLLLALGAMTMGREFEFSDVELREIAKSNQN